MKTIAGLGWHVKHHSSRKTPSKPRDPDQGMNRQLATRNFVPVEGNRLISFVGGETEKRIVKYPAHAMEDSTTHGPFDPPYGPVFNPSRDTQRYLVRVITASFFCSDRHDHATCSFGHFRRNYNYRTLNSILSDFMSNILQRYSLLPAENEGKIER